MNLLTPATGERRQVAVVAADVFCVTDGTEKHTATAQASIAMLSELNAPKIASPA